MSEQLSVVSNELSPLITQAKDLVIHNDADMTSATFLLSQMNTVMDRIKEEKEKVTRPLLDALNAERARWKPAEDLYKAAIEPLRNRISEYQTLLLRKQNEEAKRLADDVASGKVDIATASKALSQTVIKEKVKTEVGSLSFKATPTLKIISRKDIPAKYWVVDEDAVFDALKKGIVVKGAEIEIIQVPVNRR